MDDFRDTTALLDDDDDDDDDDNDDVDSTIIPLKDNKSFNDGVIKRYVHNIVICYIVSYRYYVFISTIIIIIKLVFVYYLQHNYNILFYGVQKNK